MVDRATFEQMQNKLIEARSAIKVADAQLYAREMDNKKSGLTLANVEPLADSGRYFSTVGRMFILTPKKDIVATLNKTIAGNNEEIEELKKKKVYLERTYKETEDNFREFIASQIKK